MLGREYLFVFDSYNNMLSWFDQVQVTNTPIFFFFFFFIIITASERAIFKYS